LFLFLNRKKRGSDVVEDNDKAITPSIRVKVQPKTFDEKVAQKARVPWCTRVMDTR
jgi:hypothetical protein